ncbi:MAG: radical SAM protein [Desulfurococcaceae archaeon]
MITFRGIKVYSTLVKNALSKSGLPDLDYALNPYIGCGHGCIYCYARLYTRNDLVSANWGKIVVVKSNIVNVLLREVKRLKPGIVGVGTITDAYQPVEAVYKLTRKSIEVLINNEFNVSIQTKNPLVTRDIDLFTKKPGKIDIGFTITTLNNELSAYLEPNAPPPKARINALKRIAEHGIKTWIFYGPIIPGLNDDEYTISNIVEVAKEVESTLYYDPLHIKSFMNKQDHPLYKYIKSKTREWWQKTRRIILDYCEKYRLICKSGFAGDSY